MKSKGRDDGVRSQSARMRESELAAMAPDNPLVNPEDQDDDEEDDGVADFAAKVKPRKS